MPSITTWTEGQDAQLRRLRIEGASWAQIAAAFGRTRWSVIERGRRIGARRPPPGSPPQPEDPFRDPLPPGHPRSWDALNAGTSLAGEAYPLPTFVR